MAKAKTEPATAPKALRCPNCKSDEQHSFLIYAGAWLHADDLTQADFEPDFNEGSTVECQAIVEVETGESLPCEYRGILAEFTATGTLDEPTEGEPEA